MDTTIKFGALVLGNVSLATIFGIYLARLITFESRPLEKTVGRSAYNSIIQVINWTKQTLQKKNFALYMNICMNNHNGLNINNQFININMIH